MTRLALALWADERGFILSAELVIIATTVILGLTVALVAMRDALGGEMSDLAGAFRNLDQSYYYTGMRGCPKGKGFTSWTAGSGYLDTNLRTTGPQQDFCMEDHIVGTRTLPDGTVVCPKPYLPEAPYCPVPSPAPAPCLDCPPVLNAPPIYNGPPVLQAPSVPCPGCGKTVPQSVPCPTCVPGTTSHGSSTLYAPGVSGPYLPGMPVTGSMPYTTPINRAPAGPLQVW
ncbi:hypothetical protein [Planctomicrobium piriforme]|uniref:Uncharacterized protein n=1 Tax=Planctomicrobium piriforme TaxID=1576369 RepID=A0A1I3G144_9PLAN|nr:hypothetical protein [Planctomicrobium piriforme]SFI17193.1 hypothetical protein SAMN05421753_106126 [Planctomicrobium piriforme]